MEIETAPMANFFDIELSLFRELDDLESRMAVASIDHLFAVQAGAFPAWLLGRLASNPMPPCTVQFMCTWRHQTMFPMIKDGPFDELAMMHNMVLGKAAECMAKHALRMLEQGAGAYVNALYNKLRADVGPMMLEWNRDDGTGRIIVTLKGQ